MLCVNDDCMYSSKNRYKTNHLFITLNALYYTFYFNSIHPKTFQRGHFETAPNDYAQPELGRVGPFLENGEGISGATGRCL